MTEKTNEQLQAELEMLQKQNLEKAVAKEKAKLEEESKLEALEKEKKMKESLRAEVEKEYLGKQESRIVDEKIETLKDDKLAGFERFKAGFAERRKKEGFEMTNLPYELMIKKRFGGE